MDVLMPQLGETVSEGTIAEWHKKPGDAVEKGDVLLDVETDKVATEVTAQASGTLTSIEVPQGETVDVGTVLAVIAVEGEEAAAAAEPAPAPAAEAAAPAAASAGGGLAKRTSRERLSPAVRRLLKEHNLDSGAITGSGRRGRITRKDVVAHIESGASAPAAPPAAPAPIAAPQPAAPPPVASAPSPEAGTRIPFDRIRRVTAAHMVSSKATSPHVLQTIDVDFHQVDVARLVRKDRWKQEKGYSLTYLPFVARAICMAIAEFPRVNASVEDDSLVIHADINLAIAIDLNHEGLVAAVTRNADSLSVPELAEAFNDLATRARSNRLKPDDLQGGTYTLSNPGPFGTLFTAPIINQPQVGIMSMDAVKKRPHVVNVGGSDAIAIRPIGILAHSFDHRAIDGAYSGAYLARLKQILETTDWTRGW